MSSEVEDLFIAVADLDSDARRRYLDQHCRDPQVRAEVERLAALDAGSEEFLQRPVAMLAGEIGRDEPPPQDRYRVLRPLGRGGMGSVYEAERLDGEVRLRVAIKFVPPALRSPRMIERFRQERQILANLNHPNIARLLDAGAADDGSPYLVMELVDGVPIDQWCAERRLGARETAELFLRVCAAAQHAHQQLVIHRDLKPRNILVNAAGEPKLLDFGIAKLLDEAFRLGRSTLRAFTPEYASPEQVEGLPVSAATDVYGLGAVLHKLITGSPPGAGVKISGDLGNILRRALARDPAGRYGSARELGDDLRRFVERRPVRATGGGGVYRTRCFVRRNPWLATSIAGLALSLGVGSTSMALRVRRAERRFEAANAAARDLLFTGEEILRDVPGTSEARRFLAATGIRYLDALARGNHSDRRLRADVADGYRRISEIQFRSTAASLYDLDGAARSIAKALEASGAEALIRAAEIEAEMGELGRALEHCREAQSVLAGRSNETAARAYATTALVLFRLGRLDAAAEAIGRAVSLDRARPGLAARLELRARIEQGRGRHAEAEASWREAVDLARKLNAERQLMIALGGLGSVAGNRSQQLAPLGEAYSIAERRVRRDVEDIRAQLDLQAAATQFGSALLEAGELREAGRLLDSAAVGIAETVEGRWLQALALGARGEYRDARGDRAGAREARREVVRIGLALRRQAPDDVRVSRLLSAMRE